MSPMLKAVLRGAGNILDTAGSYSVQVLTEVEEARRFRSANAALGADMRALGRDFRVAMMKTVPTSCCIEREDEQKQSADEQN
ncbi:MAG: hypothetical protein AB7E32_15900 [Desulfovibrio sp.]